METTLYNLPIISGILTRTNTRAESLGIVALMKSIVGRGRNRMEILIPKSSEKVLKNEPVLVVSNHPAASDVPMLLSTLTERSDTYLIASHHFLKILPEVDKNIIPVYISHRHWKNNDVKLKMFCKIHAAKIFNQEEAHKKNIASINLATQKIDEGGVVVIYPAAQELGNEFRNGTGYLLKNLKNPKKAKVVMAHIEGTSSWDYWRLIPFLGKIMPKIRIRFSEAIEVNKVIGKSGKITTKNLEEKYYRWVNSLFV
jgi:1-acyl-sn-glycerol-3-phosphate acyltransferase